MGENMKKFKIFCCLISMLLLSGCTVKYEVSIDSDLNVKEKINIFETISYFEQNYTYYKREEVIDAFWNNNISDYPNAGYSYIHNDNETGAIIRANYTNLFNYKDKTTIYKQYFNSLSIEEKDNIISIKADDFEPYNEQYFERFAIQDLTITINIPFEVIDSNADYIQGTNYIWYVDEDTEDKQIKISFNKSKAKNNNQNNNFYYSIIFGIIVIAIILIIYVVYRIKRNDDNL